MNQGMDSLEGSSQPESCKGHAYILHTRFFLPHVFFFILLHLQTVLPHLEFTHTQIHTLTNKYIYLKIVLITLTLIFAS